MLSRICIRGGGGTVRGSFIHICNNIKDMFTLSAVHGMTDYIEVAINL